MNVRIFERAKVDENGHIRGLEQYRGEEFLLVKAPKIAEGKNFEKSKEVLDEVFRWAKEHRDLAERQYAEFKTRHGDPAEKFRELANHLSPEEFARRTKELREFAEARVAEARKDVETTYARLEKEIEQRAQTVLGRKGEAKAASDGRAVVTIDEQAAAGSVANRDEREF